jgi:hypothetical protein
VPPDKPLVLHGGIYWNERRDADGCERNWPVDLCWGTAQDNAEDRKREAAYIDAQPEQRAANRPYHH